MKSRILVVYASKYGATAEIADRIGNELLKAGFEIQILPVKQVSEIESFNAIILGSAVYIGGWRKEAVKFIKKNASILQQKKVWLFSSGPTGKGDAAELLKNWVLPKAVQAITDRINPRSIAVFHGAVNTSKLNPIEKWMVSKVKAPIGDFRDWEAISDWTKSIITILKQN